MERKEVISKIKESLKSLMKFSNDIKNESFGSFECTDGTKITSPSTDLEVGSEVYLLDDQGNQTPLTDGEYVLTDGRTITVKSNMVEVISGGTEKPQEETETPSEEAQAEVKMENGLPDGHEADAKEEDDETKAASEMDSRIKDIEKQIEDILNILSKLGSTQTEVNEQMMSKIIALSEENGGQPIKLNKKEFNDYKKDSSSLRNELLERLNKNR